MKVETNKIILGDCLEKMKEQKEKMRCLKCSYEVGEWFYYLGLFYCGKCGSLLSDKQTSLDIFQKGFQYTRQ